MNKFYNLSLKNILMGLTAFSAATMLFTPSSSQAAKAGAANIVYNKVENDTDVVEVYNVATGTSVNIVSAADDAREIYTAHTAKSGLLVSSFRSLSAGGGHNLYSTKLKTGARTRLNGPLVENGDVITWSITESNKYVFYIADQDIDQQHEIFVTSTKKSKPVKLSSDFENYDYYNAYLVPLENGKGAFYTAPNKTHNSTGLFLSLTKEPLPREIAVPTQGIRGSAEIIATNPRSTGAIYRTNLNDPDEQGYPAYYYDIKSDTSTQITIPGISDFYVVKAKFDPAGKNIYFLAQPYETNSAVLAKYNIASKQSTLISGEMGEFQSVGQAFFLDSKGKTIYYTHNKENASRQVLYKVDVKKNITTAVSDINKDVYGFALDKAGNLWYSYWDESGQDTNVYRKPAKKGETVSVLDYSSFGEYAGPWINITETGLFFDFSYWNEVFDFKTVIFDVLKKESYPFDTLVPDGNYPELLDSLRLESVALPS